MATTRVSFVDLMRSGVRAVSRYTGTVLTVFVVQSLWAAACMLTIAIVLAQAFSHLPLFDDAVDGNLVAAIACVRYAQPSFLAVAAIAVGAICAWQLVTWFLVGGLLGVLAQKPEGRVETARCFGASGAASYLKFARLAVVSMPGWLVVMFVASISLTSAFEKIELALTVGDVIGPLLLALVPTVLLLHIVWTITDYARVELVLRDESHEPGVIATYLRTAVWVMKRPLTLLHGAFGWLVFAIITGLYLWLALGHPMYGQAGALLLFALRQGVSLARLVVKVGVIGGQVELGRTRPLPPHRPEPKVESKKP
jgi:hypothetical protein